MIKRILRFWLPHGMVQLWRRRARPEAVRARRIERARRRAAAEAQGAGTPPAERFTYAAAVRFLEERGLDPHHVRAGTIPEASLTYLSSRFDRLPQARPLIALHIGNFLGVSLAHLASALGDRNGGSKVVSIDPNLTHRGVPRTMEMALALLTHFGLEDRVGILTGYSLEKNASNQGEVFAGYDPVENWSAERACTHQLGLLETLAAGRFDLGLIDGHHDPGYLQRELGRAHALLRPGALLALDDVSGDWPEIRAVYEAVPSDRFERLGSDGRIGVLART